MPLNCQSVSAWVSVPALVNVALSYYLSVSVSFSVYVPISVCLFACLPACLPAYLAPPPPPPSLSVVSLPIFCCLSPSLMNCLVVWLSACLFLSDVHAHSVSLFLSLSLFLSPSVCLSDCFSVPFT